MLVRTLLLAAEQAGVGRKRLHDAAGVYAGQLGNLHARVARDDYRRVVRAVYELTEDPSFGLHLGERMALGSFDVLGYLIEHSPNLREALKTAMRFARFVSEGPRLALEEHGATATIALLLPEEDTPELRLAAEFSTVALLRLIRKFAGESALPRRALFSYPAPVHRADYMRVFGGREQFLQPFNGLEFDRAWLDLEAPYQDSELRSHLLARAELLLAKADRYLSAAERVRRWLEAQADLASPTLERVARELGTSARSLRRHLLAERLHFSVLLDGVRAARAKQDLADPAKSIQDAAYALGFATPSAFSRAFKRWTGMAPKDYRLTR